MKDHGGRIHLKIMIRADLRVMPAFLPVPFHQKHVVREMNNPKPRLSHAGFFFSWSGPTFVNPTSRSSHILLVSLAKRPFPSFELTCKILCPHNRTAPVFQGRIGYLSFSNKCNLKSTSSHVHALIIIITADLQLDSLPPK